MEMDALDLKALGQECRDYKSALIQSFAGELIGADYPLSEKMTEISLRNIPDEELGRKFVKWMENCGD